MHNQKDIMNCNQRDMHGGLNSQSRIQEIN